MLKRIGRLFVIKNRWEAMAVIYALGLGAIERGVHYLKVYPGMGGWLLFAACNGAVFMAGARLMEMTRARQQISPAPGRTWRMIPKCWEISPTSGVGRTAPIPILPGINGGFPPKIRVGTAPANLVGIGSHTVLGARQ